MIIVHKVQEYSETAYNLQFFGGFPSHPRTDGGDWVKFGAEESTPCQISPLRGEKPQNRPHE